MINLDPATLTPLPVSAKKQFPNDVFGVDFNGESYLCVLPTPLAEEFANNFETKNEAWIWLYSLQQAHPSGYWWEIADKKACGAALWSLLGDIPVSEDDEIEEAFLNFEIGTDKLEIWHWFEDEFDLTLASDLMHL
jgi:hypothetical protein